MSTLGCKIAAVMLLLGSMVGVAQGQIVSATAGPLTSFGVNGWLAPGSNPYLASDNNTRGIAYNSATGNLVLPSRTGGNNVAILNGTSGAVVKTMDMTGVGGGFFPINLPGVGSDGAIYVGDLTINATTPFTVYKWDSEASVAPPTKAYSALSGLARTGDSFAVFGGGASAQFSAAGSTNVSASNFVNGTLDGSNSSVPYLSIPDTLTASNDYRLSIAYVDANTIIGNQGNTGRVTTFDGTTATVDASIPLGGAAIRPLAYVEVAGSPILASMDSNNSNVFIWNIADPAAPTVLASSLNLTPYDPVFDPAPGNLNATGGIAWGPVVDNGDLTYTATLYAMNSNQGIQAFSVQLVPEPSTYSMLFAGSALAVFGLRRRMVG